MSDPQAPAVRLHYPPNGYHVCRWCNERITGGGDHADGCGYLLECDDIDKARTELAQLRLDLEARTQERDTLKEQNRQLELVREWDRQDVEVLDQLQDNDVTIREGLARVTQLRAALEKYGVHECDKVFAAKRTCTCGLDEALK